MRCIKTRSPPAHRFDSLLRLAIDVAAVELRSFEIQKLVDIGAMVNGTTIANQHLILFDISVLDPLPRLAIFVDGAAVELRSFAIQKMVDSATVNGTIIATLHLILFDIFVELESPFHA